jgi:hypothetical protein
LFEWRSSKRSGACDRERQRSKRGTFGDFLANASLRIGDSSVCGRIGICRDTSNRIDRDRRLDWLL